MFTSINPYGLTIEDVAWQVSSTEAEGNLFNTIAWGSNRPHESSVRTYNFLHDGKDLYLCKPEGIITKVPNLPDDVSAGYGPSSQYWNDTLRQIRRKGGVLLEFNSHLRDDLRECREYQFYQYSDICKKDIRKAVLEGLHSNYTFFVFISHETLKQSSTGIYIPWCGYTIGTRAHGLSNKHLTLCGLSGSDNTGYAGIRFRCMAPVGKANYLYARINDQIIRISPEDYDESDRLGVDVFITEGSNEHYIGRVSMEDALTGVYLEERGRRIWVQLYETELEAKAGDRRIQELEDKIKDLEEEIKASKKATNQTAFQKIATSLANIVAPVLKLAAVVVPVVMAAIA